MTTLIRLMNESKNTLRVLITQDVHQGAPRPLRILVAREGSLVASLTNFIDQDEAADVTMNAIILFDAGQIVLAVDSRYKEAGFSWGNLFFTGSERHAATDDSAMASIVMFVFDKDADTAQILGLPYRIVGSEIEWYRRRRATSRRDGFLGNVIDWLKGHPTWDATPPAHSPIDGTAYRDVMAYRCLRDEYPALEIHLFRDETTQHGWQLGLAARMGILD